MKTPFSGGFAFDPGTNLLKELFHVKDLTITRYDPPTVAIPVNQHIGQKNEPLVKVGESVVCGQVIAASDGFISGRVHASISGSVTNITEVPAFGGKTQPAIVISRQQKSQQTEQLTESEPLDLIRSAGIVGMGGAAFPTHVKLSPPTYPTHVHTIIINGAECEPFLSSDDALMNACSQDILQGAKIAQELLFAKRIIVGIEKDKPAAIKAMTAAAKAYADVSIQPLPVFYPQGGEKQLIETLLKKELPLGKLPSAIGVYLMNVATSAAVYHAVKNKRPLTRRLITVTGDVLSPKVIDIPLGTTCGELIEFCGGFVGAPSKILHGGPMMGRTIHDLALPLTKASNGLVVLNKQHDGKKEELPCIRCNRCVEVCPIRLEPQNLDQAIRSGDLVRAEQLLAEACINCGACTYICPARRNLAATISQAGKKIKRLQKEAQLHEKN